MDELIGQLTSKLGLTAEQGRQALDVVMGFMKDKLPADVLNQITAAVPDLGKVVGDLQGAVGDAAGQAGAAAQDVAGKASAVASDASGAAQGAVADAGTAAGGAADAAKDAAGDAQEAAGGLLNQVKGLFGKG